MTGGQGKLANIRNSVWAGGDEFKVLGGERRRKGGKTYLPYPESVLWGTFERKKPGVGGRGEGKRQKYKNLPFLRTGTNLSPKKKVLFRHVGKKNEMGKEESREKGKWWPPPSDKLQEGYFGITR